MRKTLIAVVLALTMGGMLFPAGALAKRVFIFGSLTIAKCTDVACTNTTGLTTEFNGVVFLANPGLEKTIALQVPPFAFPVFVNTDTVSPGGGDLDTTLALVNVSGGSQTIKLILRDSNGTLITLTQDIFTVDADHTLNLSLSSLLP